MYQKFIDEAIWLLESAGCIPKSLSLWTAPVIVVQKKPDPLHPDKEQLHMVLDHQLPNKSINAACNRYNNNFILTFAKHNNNTDLLARLYNGKIFSSLWALYGKNTYTT